MEVKNKIVYSDVEFEVWDGEKYVKVKGVYFICDGGYHHWSCMMCPIKGSPIRQERLWSEWVESVRKDVECGGRSTGISLKTSSWLLAMSTAISSIFNSMV